MLLRLALLDGLALLAAVLVPLGLLRHSVNGSRPLPRVPRDGADRWLLTSTRQVRRGQVVSAVVAGAALVSIGLPWLPLNLSDASLWSLSVPIGAAALGVAGLQLRAPTTPQLRSGPAGSLILTPRTVWSFGQRWWFRGWLAATVLLVGTVVAAGVISGPDEYGHFSLLTISVGSGSASSQFLGWWYGVPLLVFVSALTVVTLLALHHTSRPALPGLADTRAFDVALRTLRTRNLLAGSTGAVLVTLGLAWKLIGMAARMRGGVLTDNAGQVEVGTTFAALSTPLWAAGYLAEGLGFALLILPLIARSPRYVAAVSPDEPDEQAAEAVTHPTSA